MNKARKRSWQIKHVGFNRDGLKPETALKLYKLIIRSILEYGGQVLTYVHSYFNSIRSELRSLDQINSFVKKLEHFQTQALKNVLGAPKSTSLAIVRLFSLVSPFFSRLDSLKLRYFWKKHDVKNTIKDIPSELFHAEKSSSLAHLMDLYMIFFFSAVNIN